jgi:ABC-type antimicrobial peptide transport system permease subunit
MYAAAVYHLSESAKEIGIRLALGCSRRRLVSLLYRRYARLALVGGAVGALGGSLLIRYAAAGWGLHQPESYTPMALALAPLLCVLTVLAAIARPVFRATTLNPRELIV